MESALCSHLCSCIVFVLCKLQWQTDRQTEEVGAAFAMRIMCARRRHTQTRRHRRPTNVATAGQRAPRLFACACAPAATRESRKQCKRTSGTRELRYVAATLGARRSRLHPSWRPSFATHTIRNAHCRGLLLSFSLSRRRMQMRIRIRIRIRMSFL